MPHRKNHNQSRDLWYTSLRSLMNDMTAYIHEKADVLPSGKKVYAPEDKVLLYRVEEALKTLANTKTQEEEDGI